jgi:hypothetical protein
MVKLFWKDTLNMLFDSNLNSNFNIERLQTDRYK